MNNEEHAAAEEAEPKTEAEPDPSEGSEQGAETPCESERPAEAEKKEEATDSESAPRDKPSRRKTDKAKPPKVAETERLKAELAETKDRLLRTAAEYDNYRKRTERDRISALEYAKAQMIKPILPILDNVERAEGCEPGSPEYNKGIALIVKQFKELSGQLGLTPVGEAGEPFDPNLHEAVMHTENPDLGENVVAQVLQKGYKLGDTVIRTAMVQVAN